jgi:hypothetical protein
MASTEDVHPIWDRELDGLPRPKRLDFIPGLFRIARFRGRKSARGKDRGKIMDRMRSVLQTNRCSFAGGVFAPIVCLALDPFVFSGGDEHGPFLGRYWVFFYSLIGVEACTLTLCLWRKARLAPIAGIIAGMLMTGALLAAGIGVLVLPLSLLALLILIGVLGLVPFLTAYIYLRHALLAIRSARTKLRNDHVAAWMVLGFALALGLPASMQIGVHWAWRNAIRDVASGQSSAIGRAHFWYQFVDVGAEYPLDKAVDDEPDPVRKQRLVDVREHSWSVPGE